MTTVCQVTDCDALVPVRRDAILIHWARACIARGMNRLGPWRSAVLMIRFTTVMIVMHILQIVLWTGFLSLALSPILGV